MFEKILLSIVLTFIGSFWIDKLYLNCSELTFPDQISSRARFRKPLLFLSLAFLFNLTDDFWFIAAIFLLALMTVTDFEQYMLFDAMTLPLAVIGAIFSWQMHLDLFDHVISATVGGGVFFLLAVITKGAIGGGDIKLIAALGLWFGSQKLLNVVLIGTIVGGIAALLMIISKQKDRKSFFAYGPYFALTAIYFLLRSTTP